MAQRASLTTSEKAFVLKMRVARLATADEHGSPHLIPVCYAFDGTYFYTPLDEKPKKVADAQLRRVRNIEARHEAALLIDQYDDDWLCLGYLLVRAQADLIGSDHRLHASGIRLLRARYVQYRTMELERRQLILLTPKQVTSWGHVL